MFFALHPARDPVTREITLKSYMHSPQVLILLMCQHQICHWVAAGLVETSNNLAAVKPSSASECEAKYTITMSTRSSLTHAMEVQRARIAAIARLCGATVAQDKAYPGWAPNPASPVLQVGTLPTNPPPPPPTHQPQCWLSPKGS